MGKPGTGDRDLRRILVREIERGSIGVLRLLEDLRGDGERERSRCSSQEF